MGKSIFESEYKVLIELIRDTRIRFGFTQEQIARLISMPQSYISKIENGERRLDLIELRKICIAMNKDLKSFIKEFEKRLNESR